MNNRNQLNIGYKSIKDEEVINMLMYIPRPVQVFIV